MKKRVQYPMNLTAVLVFFLIATCVQASSLEVIESVDVLGRECVMTTFESAPDDTAIDIISGSGMNFSEWLTLQSGIANNPSGATAAYWLAAPFPNHEVTFSSPVAAVGFSYSSRLFGVVLEAYNSSGTLIARDPLIGTAIPNAGPLQFDSWAPLSVDVGSNDIAKVNVIGFAGLTAIDDFFICRIPEAGCPCEAFSVSDFSSPMGKAKKAGSTLPIKFQLFFEGAEVTSQAQLHQLLADNGCTAACPTLTILEHDGAAGLPVDSVEENVGNADDGECFRYSEPNWIYNLRLDTSVFSPGMTYQVEVSIGDCVFNLQGNNLFEVK